VAFLISVVAAAASRTASAETAAPPTAAAAADTKMSPVGEWQTVDDKTHRPKSHVKVWEKNGVLYGRIIKLIDPDEPNPLCDECKGSKLNQPIIGMVILWGLSKRDNGWWEGGRILDPENGKTYGCKIRVVQGGAKMDVRGFLGISAFGRTQSWNRIH
jgi:uncharacterized protein (DUF2147 family)